VVTRSRPRSTRLLVIALVSVSLAIITLDYREGDAGPLAEAGRWTQTAMAPLQQGVSTVTRPVGDFFSGLAHLPSLERDNVDLRAKVADLQTQIAGAGDIQDRLRTLEDLLGLKRTLDPAGVPAVVIGNGVSNFEWMITISGGRPTGRRRVGDVTTSGGPSRLCHAGLLRRAAPDRSELRGRGTPQHDPGDGTRPGPG